ncbi:integrase core domain-containing protein [Corynebacterium tuberculostearicum]|uniref:integrase core domain-containing protein n=1 Tax=Corynebacterium tuberculostearicum TaxID=38304 RepID=UPI0026483064|nr:integrase core domain-containing protein [Corynebacterium tuberculostearicum]WKE52907.1 integrase core domain-containing protein [Corynebacterium tuberculostearicum]
MIYHLDYGLQYVSIVYNERLAEHGITASTGTVGDSYDNALAENVNGSYKNELIHRRSWADVVDVEIATFEWVNWWTESRLHQSLGYHTPTQVEAEFWEHHPSQEIVEIKPKA